MAWINKLPINLPMVAKVILKPIFLVMLSVLFGWFVWEVLKEVNAPNWLTVIIASLSAGFAGKHLLKRYYPTPP